jgi:hypothetical protein
MQEKKIPIFPGVGDIYSRLEMAFKNQIDSRYQYKILDREH